MRMGDLGEEMDCLRDHFFGFDKNLIIRYLNIKKKFFLKQGFYPNFLILILIFSSFLYYYIFSFYYLFQMKFFLIFKKFFYSFF